mmetsp:Transcript_13633/g.31378  ORF Transcript_13633/g.31378 Transcript_13633/m.31378 type:complete len:332 (-) Transcript_13633:20-1015(-)
MRPSQLRTILSDRGETCPGCRDKRDFIARIIKTDKRSSSRSDKSRGKRYRGMRGDPNDWHTEEEDFRIDAWKYIMLVLQPITSSWKRYPLTSLALCPFLLLLLLKVSHRNGRHNDVPFLQYLRFQGRRKWKSLQAMMKSIWFQVCSFRILARWLFLVMKKTTCIQWGWIGLVLLLWYGAAKVGFAAVYFILLCFAVIFTNLGRRQEGQGSAYSVFNNFQPIDGDLRMEQVEAEMRNMPLPRRNRFLEEFNEGEKQEEDQPPEDAKVVKFGLNDKIEIVSKTGERKSVKIKFLQQFFDSGWRQADMSFRIRGIRYRSGGGVGGGEGDFSDSD